MRVPGIETSCDETAAAVVDDATGALSIVANVVFSQVEQHAPYGGVVPEIASREHVTRLVDVLESALAQCGGWAGVHGIAVTRGPGLVGSLLVGLQLAKGLAMARRLPWVGINHLEGHLSAALLADPPPAYPHVALVVSGGHTHLYKVEAFARYMVLGGTRD
ncbi:MAG: tRNA (adenosine(37)-N6)-threonylcarbamoyltransferase complex transferase subunit TsaD, partial [Deltaproteobacteria bacterium]|nr:tRNA (adenosine(37)-N6)-threonylcarbamoyltransferase complex transferase subunit TsaD [Deltaproteobacteria bacterium]